MVGGALGGTPFDERHFLGQKPWFWALVACMLLRLAFVDAESGPPLWVIFVLWLAFAATLGYRVRIDEGGIRVTGLGCMALFWVMYPLLTRRLQGPAGETEQVGLHASAGVRRHFGWPAIWFGRKQCMSFGAHFHLDVVRKDGRLARLYIHDGPAALAAARRAGLPVEGMASEPVG